MTKTPFKEHFFKHIGTGIADHNNTEQVRKAYLINMFTFVAILFVFPLGINAYISSLYPLSFSLLGIAFILVVNYLYLKATHNQNIGNVKKIIPLIMTSKEDTPSLNNNVIADVRTVIPIVTENNDVFSLSSSDFFTSSVFS